jgi:S-adenosylmethionine decarboxylase
MAVHDQHIPYTFTPFEGPEKLLEIWFAPSLARVPDAHAPKNGRIGLRNVPRQIWEDMLDIVKCKVLSVIEGEETDAYLLRYVPLIRFDIACSARKAIDFTNQLRRTSSLIFL